MSRLPDETDAGLKEASTIAIIVHGVGDHTPSEILNSAQSGYQNLARGAARSTMIELRDFPQPDGTSGRQRAMRIEANGQTHLVMPIVWSDLRMRATEATRRPLDRPLDVSGLLGRAFAPLVFTSFDLLRCAFKAASFTWGIALGMVDLLFTATSLAFYACLIWLVTQVVYVFGYRNLPVFRWAYALVLVPGLILIRYGLKRVLPVFDFIGDVAVYVGRPRKRKEIEAALLRIVKTACEHAPHARVLLVGHSLGSVLVSHTALQLTAVPSARGRVILLTLGSPLHLMSRVFPAFVATPSKLSSDFARDGVVQFWANMWRDSDFIGRELAPDDTEAFAETSLGAGPHWNIWPDRRLWDAVVSLLHAAERHDFTGIQADWNATEVSFEANRPEVYRIAFTLWLRRLIAGPVLLLGMFGFIFWGPAGRWFVGVQPAFATSLRIMSILIGVFTVALVFLSLGPNESMGHDLDRRYLGALRRAGAISGTIWTLLQICVALFGCTVWWAVSQHRV
jgi:pimeloyl-ACP methyl ester carboxylesterase